MLCLIRMVSARRWLRRSLAAHWAIVAAFVLAVAARIVVALGYRPALFFTDSWGYVGAAYGPSHLGGVRPPGYPLILWTMDLAIGRDLAVITTVQHIAGLATGVLVYVLLTRLDVSRLLAAAAAAIVLLDSYAIVSSRRSSPRRSARRRWSPASSCS